MIAGNQTTSAHAAGRGVARSCRGRDSICTTVLAWDEGVTGAAAGSAVLWECVSYAGRMLQYSAQTCPGRHTVLLDVVGFNERTFPHIGPPTRNTGILGYPGLLALAVHVGKLGLLLGTDAFNPRLRDVFAPQLLQLGQEVIEMCSDHFCLRDEE